MHLKLTIIFLMFLLTPFSSQAQGQQTAVFAGGCFWCMEAPFDRIEGVIATTSGYSGGSLKDPGYKDVSSGTSGHYEVLQVTFDPGKLTYQELLDVFWHNIDPLDGAGQFCDKGSQYRSAIFYANDEQRVAAEKSLAEIQTHFSSSEKVQTPILKLDSFYPAEDYHQDFYMKDPVRYKSYRLGCGRDKRLEQLWGKSH